MKERTKRERKVRTKEVKIRDRKNVWPGVCIAALLTAIIVYVAMLHAETSALENYAKNNVYVAIKEIPEGLMISESNYSEYFGLKEMDVKIIPETAINGPEQLIGLVPLYTIEKGTFITRGMFDSIDEITADMTAPVVAGFKADDLYQVVGGVLRAGDRIHLIRITDDGAELIWENVYVQSVFDQTGAEIKNEDVSTAAQRVNIYLDKEDVEDFYATLASGTVRVVKVCK